MTGARSHSIRADGEVHEANHGMHRLKPSGIAARPNRKKPVAPAMGRQGHDPGLGSGPLHERDFAQEDGNHHDPCERDDKRRLAAPRHPVHHEQSQRKEKVEGLLDAERPRDVEKDFVRRHQVRHEKEIGHDPAPAALRGFGAGEVESEEAVHGLQTVRPSAGRTHGRIGGIIHGRLRPVRDPHFNLPSRSCRRAKESGPCLWHPRPRRSGHPGHTSGRARSRRGGRSASGWWP